MTRHTQQQLLAILLYVLLGSFAQVCLAQDDGFITTLSAENGGLPPGAVYENGIVSHPISSAEENLHLLAGYYYSNPREWKRIYKDNRHVIRNPNSLPVGETLTINVGENWKPLFAYDEWFRLANRNGQWKSGHAWKPARASSGTQRVSTDTQTPESEQTTPSPPPAPTPASATQKPKEDQIPPAQIEPEVAKEMPKEEEPPPPPPEETPQPEEPEKEEEAAPAF